MILLSRISVIFVTDTQFETGASIRSRKRFKASINQGILALNVTVHDLNVGHLKCYRILVFSRSPSAISTPLIFKGGCCYSLPKYALVDTLSGPWSLCPINRENFSDGLSRSRAKLSPTSVLRSSDRCSSRYNSGRFANERPYLGKKVYLGYPYIDTDLP